MAKKQKKKNEIETVHMEKERRKNKAVTHNSSSNGNGKSAIGINRFGAVISRMLKHTRIRRMRVCERASDMVNGLWKRVYQRKINGNEKENRTG